jgi:hypothetical protein
LGYSCIAEQGPVETARMGKSATPFLKYGDHVRIEMRDTAGRSIFGAIEQDVIRYGSADRSTTGVAMCLIAECSRWTTQIEHSHILDSHI